MFGTKNQYGTISQFKVRGKDAREQDKNHTVEVVYELPLTHQLAEDILPAMAKDLFNKAKGKVEDVEGAAWEPKPELSETTFNMNLDPQLMEVRQHPDLDPVCRQNGVTVRQVVAYKSKANTWMLSFTAGFTLGDENVPIQLIRNLKQGVYLSFEAEEPKLDLKDQGEVIDAEVPGDAQEAQPRLPTPITAGRRGRRKALAAGESAPATEEPAGDEPAPGNEADPTGPVN